MKKAIFIDVKNQSISECTLGDHYTEISRKIGNGCELFCCPFEFNNGDTIFADEESLCRYDDIVGGFKYSSWSYPIIGNAVILGINEDGESTGVKSTIQEISQGIVWLSETEAKKYSMNPPETLILTF